MKYLYLFALLLAGVSTPLWDRAVQAETPPYYNSSDPGCDPLDPDVLFCEGFETPNPGSAPCDNRWGHYADSLVPPGDFDGCSKGWGMHFTCPVAYPECVESGVTPFGTYAGNFEAGPGSGGNGADHLFVGQVARQSVYFRWYQKWKSGTIGAEKIFQPMYEGPNAGGIDFGDLHTQCGGGASSSQALMWQPVAPAPDVCLDFNYTITTGQWYAFQLFIQLSTTESSNNGILRFYADDCGAAGTSCSGSMTLRATHTNVNFPVSSKPSIRSGWWNAYSNPSGTSEEIIDEIMVKIAGPIGFAGTVSEPPPPPSPVRFNPTLNLRADAEGSAQ